MPQERPASVEAELPPAGGAPGHGVTHRTMRAMVLEGSGPREVFLALAAKVPLRVEARPRPLAEANEVLDNLRAGRLRGAFVFES